MRARRLIPCVVTLDLAVHACVTWQDALRADLVLCNADKDALRGEVATAGAAVAVLQHDRVRACKLGGGVVMFVCSSCWTPCCCGD